MTEITEYYMKYRKRLWIAYLLWAIGGAFGLHRLYFRDYFAFAVMTTLTVFSFGLLGIVGIIDVKNIKGMTENYNRRLYNALTKAYRQSFLKGAY